MTRWAKRTSTRTSLRVESLENREVPSTVTGPSSSQSPYLVPTAGGVETTSLLTVGDAVDGYRMVGIPDGLGAYDNHDGTFTVVMNHELGTDSSGNPLGAIRDHGSAGAFVSKWVIDKSTLEVLSGDDLIKTLYVWDSTANSYVVGTGALNALNRLCSADLPEATAFFDPATGNGTTARIFMNGEETSNGRAFAHVVTGAEAGTSWELPWTGKYAWENHVASPFPQTKTIVVGLDDSNRNFSSVTTGQPSEVYVWVGDKKSSGIAIEKAGLVDGILHGLRVGLPGSYDANEGTVTSGERFELVPLSDQTNNPTYTALQQESINKTITQFRRVEDGHFDPTNRDVFYFVTTDQFGGSTRMWKLTFDDITQPENGGTIEISIDSPAGVPGEMFDNMTVNSNGDALLQEDPGNQTYIAKVWQWDASTSDLIQIAQHDPARFGAPGIDLYPDAVYPQYPGVQGTLDEESSGVIDLSSILGPGYYLADVQAHYRFGALDTELVEAGQLLVINTNDTSAELVDGVLTVTGTVNDDAIAVTKWGNTISVTDGFNVLGTYKAKDVDTVLVDAGAGSDLVFVGQNVKADAIVLGGLGNDQITGGGGTDILIGGEGIDVLMGGSKSDILIGDSTTHDSDHAAWLQIMSAWSTNGSYASRVSAIGGWLNSSTVVDDGDTDRSYGLGSSDLFFAGVGDTTDAHGAEIVN